MYDIDSLYASRCLYSLRLRTLYYYNYYFHWMQASMGNFTVHMSRSELYYLTLTAVHGHLDSILTNPEAPALFRYLRSIVLCPQIQVGHIPVERHLGKSVLPPWP